MGGDLFLFTFVLFCFSCKNDTLNQFESHETVDSSREHFRLKYNFSKTIRVEKKIQRGERIQTILLIAVCSAIQSILNGFF